MPDLSKIEPAILEIAKHDPILKTVIDYSLQNDISNQQMLEAAVVDLANNRAYLAAELVKYVSKFGSID